MAGALATTGCNEVRGRRKIQEGNRAFRDGQYKDAVTAFDEAEQYVPNFWILWLNKGYTCRQEIIPGAKTPENTAAVDCALKSFKRLQELKPDDPRGELLYLQTLFDGDKFDELAKLYEARFQKNPRDIDSVNGLIQVYSKQTGKLDETLEWYNKKAELTPNDPEAQYSVGVFIWQQLMSHGGGTVQASFDPRFDPNKPKKKQIKLYPADAPGDIVGQQRVDLADKGIEYLQKAVALRPKYAEAMVYVNLLFRQRAYASFQDPEQWQKDMDKATEWLHKYQETIGKPVAAAKPPGTDDETVDSTVKPGGDGGGKAVKKKGAAGKKHKRGKR